MKKSRMQFVFVGIIVIVLITNASAFGGLPHRFWGEVTIGDSPALDGTVVSALIDGIEYANTTTSGGKYTINVPRDDPTTDTKNGGIYGDTVVFYVNNIESATYKFVSGDITQLNLIITSNATPTPPITNTPTSTTPTTGTTSTSSSLSNTAIDKSIQPPPAPDASNISKQESKTPLSNTAIDNASNTSKQESKQTINTPSLLKYVLGFGIIIGFLILIYFIGIRKSKGGKGI